MGRGLAAWSAGAVYVLSAVACCVLAARSQAHVVDLHVYRMGGATVRHGGSHLYQVRFFWLPFTYPPFAAVVFPSWAVALAVATAAIWLEPARATLGYGQVDILLTAAMRYDLSLPDTARLLLRSVSYVLIGLAVLAAGAWSQVRSALSPAAPGPVSQRRTA